MRLRLAPRSATISKHRSSHPLRCAGPVPISIPEIRRRFVPVVVLVAGQPATVLFKGLAPGFPGLYQFNVTLPTFLGSTGSLPLAVQTLNAYHDQVDTPIH